MHRLSKGRITGAAEGQRPLDAIFAPRTVAVIGATEKPGSPGRAVLWNLISNPGGVNVTMCNGSVKFIKDTINVGT